MNGDTKSGVVSSFRLGLVHIAVFEGENVALHPISMEPRQHNQLQMQTDLDISCNSRRFGPEVEGLGLLLLVDEDDLHLSIDFEIQREGKVRGFLVLHH